MSLSSLGPASLAGTLERLERSLTVRDDVSCGPPASVDSSHKLGKGRSELSGGEVHPCGCVVVAVISTHYGSRRDRGLLALKEVFDRTCLVCVAIRVQGGLSEVVKQRMAGV